MGPIVNGFEIHCNATIKGKFARTINAMKNTINICKPTKGEKETIKPQNSAGFIAEPLNDHK